MGTVINDKLETIGAIIQGGLDTDGVLRILRLLDVSAYTKELMEDLTLYPEFLFPWRGKCLLLRNNAIFIFCGMHWTNYPSVSMPTSAFFFAG